MLELVHYFLNFLAPVHLDFEIVTSVRQVCRNDKEPLIDLVKGNGHLELLVRPLTILLVLSHGNGHLADVVRLVSELDNVRRGLLLRATWAPLLVLLLLLNNVLLHWVRGESVIGTVGWLPSRTSILLGLGPTSRVISISRRHTITRVSSSGRHAIQSLVDVGGRRHIHRLG